MVALETQESVSANGCSSRRKKTALGCPGYPIDFVRSNIQLPKSSGPTNNPKKCSSPPQHHDNPMRRSQSMQGTASIASSVFVYSQYEETRSKAVRLIRSICNFSSVSLSGQNQQRDAGVIWGSCRYCGNGNEPTGRTDSGGGLVIAGVVDSRGGCKQSSNFGRAPG